MSRAHKRLLVILAAALAGTLLFVTLFSGTMYRVEAFTVTLSLGIFDSGFTEVVIPPVGEIRAQTHLPPLKFTIALKNVDVELLRRLVKAEEQPTDFIPRLERRLRAIVNQFILRVLLLAALGGAFGLYMVGRRQWRDLAMGIGAGLLLMATLLAAGFQTYRLEAFREPHYTGILRAAPWMVGLMEETIVKVETLADKLETLAGNLYVLFERIDRLEPLGTEAAAVRILLVSDLHNNPAALDFVRRIIGTFGIHFVIDAGDITDFGTVFEARTLRRLVDLGVPYLLAPGNHDAPELLEELQTLPNVVVLDNRQVTTLGVRVIGSADPSARSTSPALPTAEELADQIRIIDRLLVEAVEKPLILVVHDPLAARPFIGEVPILVTGHTHRLSVRQEGDSLLLNPGSTGAAGIRGLQATSEIPYSVIILYLNREGETPRVLAVDSVKVFNLRGGFVLERKFDPLAPPGEPETPVPPVRRPAPEGASRSGF